MAHLGSARMAAGSCCARCLRPVGSMQQAWARGSAVRAEEAQAARRRLAKKLAAKSKGKSKKAAPAAQADPPAQAQAQDASDEAQLSLPADLPFLSEAAAVSADASPSASDAHTLRIPACAAVPCARGCADVYCSAQCRDLAFAHEHELLCPGGASGQAAAAAACAALSKHAASNNEIFLLAAQSVARITLGALRQMREIPAVHEALGPAHGHSENASVGGLLPFALRLHAHLATLEPADADALRASLSSCAANAAAPFLRFCGAVWWEHVSVPESVSGDPDEEAEYREALCGVAERSLTLLSEVAAAQLQRAQVDASMPDDIAPSSPPSWEDLQSSLCLDDCWSLSLFGHVLSSFERNNIGLHAPTALGLYVAHVRGLDEAHRARAVEQIGSDVWTAMQRRADGTESAAAVADAAIASASASAPASSVEGTGLFVVGCCMNHSCAPNISIRSKFAAADDAANEMNDAALMERMRSLLLHGSSDDQTAASSASAAAAAAAVPAVLLDRSAVFVALRDIAAGEELNISYIDLLQPASSDSSATAEEVGFAARQQQLRAYDFDCQCTKCVQEQGSSSAGADAPASHLSN